MLPIITADQRLATASGIKGQIWGRYKIGKTSLLYTLPAESTLAIDLEAGMLSVAGWPGDSLTVRTWDEARDLACFIGGPNPALRPDQAYSEAHYKHCLSRFGDPAGLAKYQTFFVDSLTVASRLCLQWAKGQPEAMSERTGKPDMRGAYGLLGRELIAWADQLQHIPDRNIWMVGGLDEKEDEFGRKFWKPLIDGNAGANGLPYVVDQVITMAEFKTEDGRPYRAFVCGPNQWGYPAGDRSGRLDVIEEPHLGRLMEKIRGQAKPAAERLTHTIPTETETTTEKEAA